MAQGGQPADAASLHSEQRRNSTQVVIGGRLERFMAAGGTELAQVRCQVFTGFDSEVCLIGSEYAMPF